MPEIPESELWSVDRTAKFLNCSAGTVRNMLKQNKLPCLRFGTHNRVLRIHKDDVLVFIERQRGTNKTNLNTE